MGNQLNELIKTKREGGEKLLSIYTTAGFPEPEATRDIILALANSGVDLIELGIPFLDPIADGPIIQAASHHAIEKGFRIDHIFRIVEAVREYSPIPILLMGYLNPIYKIGIAEFIFKAYQTGADGLIIPDWPLEESAPYQHILTHYEMNLVQLIAPNTPLNRIHAIDAVSTSFIYCVAYTGVTGQDNKPTKQTTAFFKALKESLNHPFLIGFGVKNRQDFLIYSQYGDGVIIGSAFIQLLQRTSSQKREQEISKFIRNLRGF